MGIGAEIGHRKHALAADFAVGERLARVGGNHGIGCIVGNDLHADRRIAVVIKDHVALFELGRVSLAHKGKASLLIDAASLVFQHRAGGEMQQRHHAEKRN